MAGPLSWLLGDDDSTTQLPLQPQLRAYNPNPSERVGSWLQQGLIGLGAQPYTAGHLGHGLRDILSATPLGIGMSAADVAHYKAAENPGAMAAAAIGMIPGIGPEAKAGINAAKGAFPKSNTTEDVMRMLENALDMTPHTPVTSKGVSGNLGEMTNSLESFLTGNTKPQVIPPGWEPMGKAAMTNDWLHPEDMKFHGGEWLQKVGLPNTKKAGQIPEALPTTKTIYDWEKDDAGSYHVFDATTGKTKTVVNTPNEAKAWIAKQQEAPTALKEQFMDLPGVAQTSQIPARPPWLDTVLPEPQREAARLAGGYTTPAYRGISVSPGKDIGTVFNGDEMFSSNNPKLADMYTSYLTKHPGETPGPNTYQHGATTMPLWINPTDYHVADAEGAMWRDFNWKAIREAKDQGKKGVVIHNVWDEPVSTKALGTPNTVYITFPEGLSTVKSKNAGQFNTSSKDIAKSIAAAFGIPTMALPLMQRGEQKQ